MQNFTPAQTETPEYIAEAIRMTRAWLDNATDPDDQAQLVADLETLEARRPACAVCSQPAERTVDNQPVCTKCAARIIDYAERVEARLTRLQARADAIKSSAEADIAQAKRMADVIPFGQPILVGHHSEGRDRRYRGRIESTFRRGYEKYKKAEDAAQRATAAAKHHANSSDDPAAVIQMREKIAQAEREQQQMKDINAAVKVALKRPEGERIAAVMAATGLTEKRAASVLEPDFMGRRGIPSYALTNNGANIRRMKERLADLEAQAKRAAEQTGSAPTEEIAGVTIERDAVENRLRLIFPAKPDAATIKDLKSRGFKWSPSQGAWQRQLNNGAEHAAEMVLKAYADR